MSDNGFKMQKKPLILSNNEHLQMLDFRQDDGADARYAIWAYVEEDIPIPNELKPILLELLQQNYKGKSKAVTAANWTIRIREVAFAIRQFSLTQEKAIEKVAAEHNLHFETLERNYKDTKYKRIKDPILSGK